MAWITRICYVDIDTGEVLGNRVALDDYIIIKTETTTTYNQTTENGTKYRTTYVRRNNQINLFEETI